MSEPTKPPVEGLLGYINFSTGKPEPRFQKQINEAYAVFAAQGGTEPARDLYPLLRDALTTLHQNGGAAFREASRRKRC